MFPILITISVIGILVSVYFLFEEHINSIIPKIIISICIVLFISAWFTPTGHLIYLKLWAGSKSGNWLIVDCSGGKTMRHWIIQNGYVRSSDQSDGWAFYDHNNNLCYIGGDTFIMKIEQPIDEFVKNYKKLYNIPEDQEFLF